MIRTATPDDAAAIRAIYGPVVRDSIATFETEVPSLEEVRRRIASLPSPYPWLVWEGEGGVLGYAYGAPYHRRSAYAWSSEVSVYVSAAARGTGAGKALLGALVEELQRRGFVNVAARIALPNDASVGLFESHGFECVGTAHGIGYKLGRWVDVGEWQRQVNPRGPEPSPPTMPG